MARSSGPVYCCVNPGSKEGVAGGISCTMPCCTTPGESGDSRTRTGLILDMNVLKPTSHLLRPRARPARLSLVIPMYNEEAVVTLLREAVGSFARTLWCDIELVLVNDGS